MKKIIGIVCVILIISCAPVESDKVKSTILFIVSNAHYYGTSEIQASNHFAEIVLAYDEFVKAGYAVDFVSPEGGAIPIGYLNTSNTTQKKYVYDFEFMNLLKNTYSPNEITPSKYKAVYYVGGGAAMFGVPENKDIQTIAMIVYEDQKGIVSAICHGSAGLVNLKMNDGRYLVAGKKVNGFPDKFERMDAEYYATFPFSIEQKLTERGGDFSFSSNGWDDYSVADGRLITGQDPTAARSTVQKIIKAINTVNK